MMNIMLYKYEQNDDVKTKTKNRQKCDYKMTILIWTIDEL